MSRILIHMYREHGHLLPTLKLARSLAAAGHQVEYLLTPPWRSFVESRGLTLRPYLEAIYPEWIEGAWARMSRTAREADAARRDRARIDWIVAGGLGDVYRAAAPDLILGDAYDVSVPIAARRLGIDLLLLSPSLFQGREPGVPPLSSAAPWGPDPAARRAAEEAWRRLAEERQRSATSDWYPGYVDALIRAYAFPRDEITWDGAIVPDFPALDQLVLCPSALEFPRPLPQRCHYDVPSILEREEELSPSLAAWLQRSPLVYCAPGSQGMWRAQHDELFAEVLALAERRPEVTFVIAHGTRAMPAPESAPANVCLTGWAPQHAVLRAADVMISVGGLGTVKECLWYGVPIILAPHLNPYDAQGNARRIVHHGLGEIVPEAQLGRSLEGALERALSGVYAEPMARIQATIKTVEASDRGRALVERWLRGEALRDPA